jgi:hypothetical protein
MAAVAPIRSPQQLSVGADDPQAIMTNAYDEMGLGYPLTRQADPRIAERVIRALGDSAAVVNVGAGTGSYEPRDRMVVAVEPSATMIRQRPAALEPLAIVVGHDIGRSTAPTARSTYKEP